MKERLLQYLACPSCGDSIQLRDILRKEEIEIIDGLLACAGCAGTFPIVRGIPRFADLGEIEKDKQATAEKFGWSWQTFSQEDEKYEEQFLGWISPVRKEFFTERVVLEGGCGKGRHTRRVAQWGARDVVAVDLSAAVEVAFSATRNLENAHVIQADIFNLPLKRAFDYAFSIGVLHHLPDPRGGFKSLVSKVKSGGHVSAWVYGAENNGWLGRLVNSMRGRMTSRMNPRGFYHLSKISTAIMYAATKLFYGPVNRSARGAAIVRHSFYNDYLNFVSQFNWREQHLIVFDHLVAPTSFYISREEFESWWKEVDAKDVVIGWHNKNSWRGFGRIER